MAKEFDKKQQEKIRSQCIDLYHQSSDFSWLTTAGDPVRIDKYRSMLIKLKAIKNSIQSLLDYDEAPSRYSQDKSYD